MPRGDAGELKSHRRDAFGIEHLFDRQLTTMPTKVASDSGLGNLFPYCMDNLG